MAKKAAAVETVRADEPAAVANGVVLEPDGRVIAVPEGWAVEAGLPARFEREGGVWEHVSEDAEGRWVYRRWP